VFPTSDQGIERFYNTAIPARWGRQRLVKEKCYTIDCDKRKNKKERKRAMHKLLKAEITVQKEVPITSENMAVCHQAITIIFCVISEFLKMTLFDQLTSWADYSPYEKLLTQLNLSPKNTPKPPAKFCSLDYRSM
jgi:hypothetical protein